MKRCPECRRDYSDDTLLYCLEDGTALVQGSVPSPDEPATAILPEFGVPPSLGSSSESPTRAQIHTTAAEAEPQENLGGSTEKHGFAANRAAKPQAAFVVAVLLLVGGFFGYRYFSASGSKQIESIAVMPFVNESKNEEVEYLADGMTETLISSLSQVPNLNVKGRSSVFRYKGKDSDTKTLGSELGVQAVLYGRVIQRGEQLTLSLELLDAVTENVIWSGKYDRKQADIVSLQSEIAKDVSAKLKLKLSGTDAAKVEKTYTADPGAYQLYLKGRFQWNKRTGDSLKQAVGFFNQAVEKDPNYALAYSGLAESYVLFPSYSVAPPLEAMPKAKAAALRAIELDNSLAEARVALGMYHVFFAWNRPAAETEFRRAIELDPNYATAHQQFGDICLNVTGRFDEALAEAKRAEELDPLSPIIGADVGHILTNARRFDEAITQLNKIIALDQNFSVAYDFLGRAYHAKGQYPEAIAAYRKGLTLSDDPFMKALLIRSFAKIGERGEAVKLFDELKAESARRYVSGSAFAIAYGAFGEKDKAFVNLDKEIAERSSRADGFAVSPIWDDLRDDPRFAELVRRVEASKLD